MSATRDSRPARVVVCPDSFKGTFSALEVASAIAAGLHDSGVSVVVRPMADGGEGTAEVLRSALGGTFCEQDVSGPLAGRTVTGRYLLVPESELAVVDTASASGLTLVAPAERDAWAATSRGTGELIAAAAASGARTVWVGVGGSGCTDGGEGAVQALRQLPAADRPALRVLCDVRTCFEDAARVFGPQKGADAAMVARLSARLAEQAAGLPRDPRGLPMTGAAGGLSGALWAAFDAELVAGADVVLTATGVDEQLVGATAVVTGEGRLDGQSGEGKVVDAVLRAARRNGVPVHAVVGSCALNASEVQATGLSSVTEAGTIELMRAAGRALGEKHHATSRSSDGVRTT